MTDPNTFDAWQQSEVARLRQMAAELSRALKTLSAEGYVLVRQEQGEGTND